jgi:hypothetical protein
LPGNRRNLNVLLLVNHPAPPKLRYVEGTKVMLTWCPTGPPTLGGGQPPDVEMPSRLLPAYLRFVHAGHDSCSGIKLVGRPQWPTN